MELTIGVCYDDAKTVNKNYTVKGGYPNTKVKDSTDIINPTFIISTPYKVEEMNYCYCEDWKRYYYIDNINVMNGERVALTCRVDVLMSFKDEIKNLDAVISKQKNVNKSNLYFNDGSFATLNKTESEVINFPSGFNEAGEYILITAGG